MKTQELRLIVFLARYLDLFQTFNIHYIPIVKVLYITVTAGIIIGIKYTEPIKSVYNFEQDAFPHWKYCVAPCAVLTVVTTFATTSSFGFVRAFKMFSFYLESVAILPQLVVLRRYRLVENLTGSFVFFLGAYRVFYVWDWIHNGKYYDRPKLVAGVIQALLYADFFYQYGKASRFCGFATRDCLGRLGLDNCGDGDDDDDDLVFELSGRDPKNSQRTTGADTDAIEPLLLVLGDDGSEAI